MRKRITVKAIRKREVSSQDLALVYWLQAKRILRERREQEEREKAERRARQEQVDER